MQKVNWISYINLVSHKKNVMNRYIGLSSFLRLNIFQLGIMKKWLQMQQRS